ncbi:MAG TPA: DMT family transporter [Casimicrobiaceae bacterium]|nr:DMT family transporter [Casimicrobiaceae bacterium]
MRGAGVTYAKLTLMALLWGGTFIGGRIATGEMAPPAVAMWRYAIAVVPLLALAYALEGGLARLNARQWVGVALLGATGVLLFNLCFMYGLARVPASRASLIMAVNPAVTLLGAAIFLRERMTRGKVLGVLVALAGVVVVLSHGNPVNLARGSVGAGEIVLFGCPLAWAANTVVARRMLPDVSAIAATAWSAIVGTAMLAIVNVFTGTLAPLDASWRAWAALLFLAVFGTAIALVLFYDGVRRLGAARASVFINLVPVFAVVLGVLLLGERLELSMVTGGALVVAGVYLLNRPEPPRRLAGTTHAA